MVAGGVVVRFYPQDVARQRRSKVGHGFVWIILFFNVAKQMFPAPALSQQVPVRRIDRPMLFAAQNFAKIPEGYYVKRETTMQPISTAAHPIKVR